MTDAIVVGSGPNGLAAAVTLARAGLDVTVFEAQDSPGGSARTFDDPATDTRHDWGSAVHPMAFASPFFTAFDLSARVSFVTPEASYAHPLEGGRAGIARRTGRISIAPRANSVTMNERGVAYSPPSSNERLRSPNSRCPPWCPCRVIRS